MGEAGPETPSASPERPKPFIVAHRAGNRLADLRAAELAGAALVEADIRLFRGRLEVRHLRTVGPLPILWDRWQLAARWRPRLRLRELLDATEDETELMLDLKGSDARVGEMVCEDIGAYLGSRRFTVCARSTPLLEPFAGLPVRRIHSIGTSGELRRFLERFATDRLDGVSVHERLLHAESVASLRAIADVIMTWPVNEVSRARELVELGVQGLITDDAGALSEPGVLAAQS